MGQTETPTSTTLDSLNGLVYSILVRRGKRTAPPRGRVRHPFPRSGEYTMEHVEKPSAGMSKEVEAVMEALSAPFARTEVKFKPGVVSGNRALALHFVD